MPFIASYSFGRMEINRITYSKDVIILPDGSILSPWWRREGHSLVREDINELVEANPEIIIAGTGASGMMKPSSELQKFLKEQTIEFIAQPTADAVRTYNILSETKKTGGCFHLTC